MKKIFTFLAMVLITINSFTQTFEYQYTGDFGQIYQVADNEFVYGILDDSLKQFKIYSLDHSLIKTIYLIPDSAIHFYILNLSKTLFNSDSKFELLYKYLYFTPSSAIMGIKVLNEDGTILFTKYSDCDVYLFNTNQGSKMLLSPTGGEHIIDVYSLYGIVLESEEIRSKSDSRLFPNPSNDKVIINFNIPDNEKNLLLSIYTISGQFIKQINIESTDNSIQVNVSEFKPGVYLYRIHNDTFSTITNKFVVRR